MSSKSTRTSSTSWTSRPPLDAPTRPTVDDVITSLHALIYSDDPPATRAFLRDVLGWPNVEHPEFFTTPVTDHGFGLTTLVDVPGADPLMLSQPTHPTAYDL